MGVVQWGVSGGPHGSGPMGSKWRGTWEWSNGGKWRGTWEWSNGEEVEEWSNGE